MAISDDIKKVEAEIDGQIKALKAKRNNLETKAQKIKRFIINGWDTQPAWIRATGWFVLGNFVVLLFK